MEAHLLEASLQLLLNLLLLLSHLRTCGVLNVLLLIINVPKLFQLTFTHVNVQKVVNYVK